MISRHIRQAPENDNYRRLALYIADASHRGEKALMNWCAGCWADDDYRLAIHEVEAVQAMNTRSGKEKTYHLIVSFHPEDEAKLTPELFHEIEKEFATALGFGEHQRHCGVHKNTANIHLHMAYNQIHPERHTRHEPYRDFWIRDRVCRQLEVRYGLTMDAGHDPDHKPTHNDRAQTYESRTGQESLFSYALQHKETLLNDLAMVTTWADCHQAFRRYGLAIKPHGHGLVIQDLNEENFIKASALDRSLGKGKLEKWLGPFVAATSELTPAARPEFTYNAVPLQQGAERGNLYAEYSQAMAERRAQLAEMQQQEERLHKTLRQSWDQQWNALKKLPMLRPHRQQARRNLEARKKAELATFRCQMKQRKDEIRGRYPFTSWNKFLQHRAGQGNETALAILRSRKAPAPAHPKSEFSPPRDQQTLTALAQMREVLAGEAATFGKPSGFKYHIDGKGTIIFILPDGVTIRDTGTRIHFNANNEKAQGLAAKLATIRWGRSANLDENTLTQNEPLEQQPQQPPPDRSSGLERG